MSGAIVAAIVSCAASSFDVGTTVGGLAAHSSQIREGNPIGPGAVVSLSIAGCAGGLYLSHRHKRASLFLTIPSAALKIAIGSHNLQLIHSLNQERGKP